MFNYIDYRKVEKPLNLKNFTVEIGFGGGDYIVSLAKERKDEVFFGIEKSWIPVNKLLNKCKKDGIKNIYCTKIDAYWAFQLLFEDCSVKEIIMNYPDPWPKKSHENKRLTSTENLHIYAKKLIHGGTIRLRTDDYMLVDYTLKECEKTGAFDSEVIKPVIKEPITKYEKKWLSIGKSIWDLILTKNKDPFPLKIRQIKEVKELYPLRISSENINIESLINREFKIENNLYIKIFSAWRRNEDFAIEVLLSENGLLQSFLVTVKKRDSYYIINISKFSEVLKTEGIKKALLFLSKVLEEKKT
ncbi:MULTISPECIES: tRNA (guanosine(46)-N7)-methyltransferase TrmB [Thermodesulfovibrio]|jgi:tRNA (guanine-N7-)-methyltransferase|uniref:tRNA (guanosine(46)-N7)-methyltransferase TrmB n=1 Tax=Thermodesulfovibrio TaxID=28261 RepID=UPI0026196FCD|nr:tRNA (guanosine(46)-N7)-methyltransferase TrmB [Thermodesulfovibrio sp.]